MKDFSIKKLNIPDIDIENIKSIDEDIRLKQLKCEENCIKEVISNYTGKPVTIENASKVQRIYMQGEHSKYILAYDGVQLGMVRLMYKGFDFVVEFNPNELQF